MEVDEEAGELADEPVQTSFVVSRAQPGASASGSSCAFIHIGKEPAGVVSLRKTAWTEYQKDLGNVIKVRPSGGAACCEWILASLLGFSAAPGPNARRLACAPRLPSQTIRANVTRATFDAIQQFQDSAASEWHEAVSANRGTLPPRLQVAVPVRSSPPPQRLPPLMPRPQSNNPRPPLAPPPLAPPQTALLHTGEGVSGDHGALLDKLKEHLRRDQGASNVVLLRLDSLRKAGEPRGGIGVLYRAMARRPLFCLSRRSPPVSPHTCLC